MSRGRRVDTSREGGRFVALPNSVLESQAYMRLSYPARALLLELALQYRGDDNGRLLCSGKHLAKRGWKSNDVISRAKRELLEGGFIHETVKGQRPNKASWYAVTWRTLDKLQGMDPEAVKTFERGAYRKNDGLTPSGGVERASIAPSHGVRRVPATPSHGAMRGKNNTFSTPSGGDPLDKPSVGAVKAEGKGAVVYSLPLIRKGRTDTWAGAFRLTSHCRPISYLAARSA